MKTNAHTRESNLWPFSLHGSRISCNLCSHTKVATDRVCNIFKQFIICNSGFCGSPPLTLVRTCFAFAFAATLLRHFPPTEKQKKTKTTAQLAVAATCEPIKISENCPVIPCDWLSSFTSTNQNAYISKTASSKNSPVLRVPIFAILFFLYWKFDYSMTIECLNTLI